MELRRTAPSGRRRESVGSAWTSGDGRSSIRSTTGRFASRKSVAIEPARGPRGLQDPARASIYAAYVTRLPRGLLGQILRRRNVASGGGAPRRATDHRADRRCGEHGAGGESVLGLDGRLDAADRRLGVPRQLPGPAAVEGASGDRAGAASPEDPLIGAAQGRSPYVPAGGRSRRSSRARRDGALPLSYVVPHAR